MTLLLLLSGPPVDPLEPAPVVVTVVVPGPGRVVEPGPYLQPAPVVVTVLSTGPTPPAPAWQPPVIPRPVRVTVRVVGPQVPSLPPPPPPAPGTYPGPAPLVFDVSGVSGGVRGASCAPSWNNVGSGELTLDNGTPSSDTEVGFNLGGTRLFTGYVAETVEVQENPSEEDGDTTSVRVIGLLDDWERTRVFPDFGGGNPGSGGPERLGPPIADVRHFDFTMNGATEDGFSFGVSSSRDPVLAALDPDDDNRLDLPDGFSDAGAMWMWAGRPGAAPVGWVSFRESTLSANPAVQYLVEAQCYDSGEVWIDGALVLTLDTAGETKRTVTRLGRGFHLCTPRVHNGGGRAGLILSIRPMVGQSLGAPILRSGAGWTTIPYVENPLVRTVGQVLVRLVKEAAGRGAPAGDWTLAFGGETDSAGRAWNEPTTPFALTIGSTYLGVLRSFAETELDFAAAPSTRLLYAWRKDLGTGRGRSLPWGTGYLRSRAVTRSVR